MTLKTPLFPPRPGTEKVNRPDPRKVRRMLAIIVAAPILGLAATIWSDWDSRGGYEPIGYYFANTWNSWRAVTPANTDAPAIEHTTSIAQR